MSDLAPSLQAFFTERLAGQRQVSPHTIAAYRDTLKLLLAFAARKAGKTPSKLGVADLDAPLIGAFLRHLETERNNSARTRNARLSAIHSLFRYLALRHPEHAAVIQRVLAIPSGRFDRAVITYLTDLEIDALLAAPDQDSWTGRRDHALLRLACETGLRASEILALTIGDLHLGTGAHVSCIGKGRRQRVTPLSKNTTQVLAGWIAERGGNPADPLFPTRRGTPLSRDALRRLLTKHATTAAAGCATMQNKNITPHVLRHSAAMALLRGGADSAVIALWLGHANLNTVQTYLHADMAIKEQALARTAPRDAPPGRYQPDDSTIAFLNNL